MAPLLLLPIYGAVLVIDGKFADVARQICELQCT